MFPWFIPVCLQRIFFYLFQKKKKNVDAQKNSLIETVLKFSAPKTYVLTDQIENN